MAVYNKFEAFIADIHNGVHNLSSDTISVVFTDNTNPPIASNSILTDLTGSLSMANAGDVTISLTSSDQTGGLYSLVLVDKLITATGAVGPFQWIVLYNSTAVDNPLIGYFDYGTLISLADTQTFTLDFDPTGLFTNT